MPENLEDWALVYNFALNLMDITVLLLNGINIFIY